MALGLFQHPDRAPARAGKAAAGIHRVGAGPILLFLEMLADLEQEFLAPALQPVVAEGVGGQVAQDLVGRFEPGGETLLASVQGEVVIDVGALAETARGLRELHLFVTEQAEVGQHEFGPVLVQVAEENQAQAVAQGFDQDAQGMVGAVAVPVGKGLLPVEMRAQAFQLLGLAGSGFMHAG